MNLAVPSYQIETLASLLEEIAFRSGHDFSGIGLVVTDSPESLPIVGLRPTCRPTDNATTAVTLANISYKWHEHHDGFHVLTSGHEITKVAQYFSPAIKSAVRIDRSKRFGGRYLAALFGSVLPEVLATGIASRDFGVAIFQNGEEKIYHAVKSNPLLVGADLG